MKLLDCYIEGFGKFSRQSFSFAESGQYCTANGWGKSTLAAFIRVMFYGFAGERRQDELSNERKRYAPWQGGGYGGELSFQARGKSYRISRSFGINQGKDVFELRDWASNQISRDFTDRIGEELFQIDARSFARTLFIAQNDAKSMETTPLIQAKIGRISEDTADLGGYDSAIEKLTKKLAELNGRSPAALLPALKNQMTALAEEIKSGAALERRETALLQTQAEQKKRRVQLRQEMEADRAEKEKQLIKAAARRARQTAYELTEEEAAHLARLRLRFAAGRPERAEIERALAAEREIALLQSELALRQMTEAEQARLLKYEKIFTRGWPTEPELEQQIEGWQQKAAKEQKQLTDRLKAEELGQQIEGLRRQRRIADACLFLAGAVFLAMIGVAFWQPLAAAVFAVIAAAAMCFGWYKRSRCRLKDKEQEYFLVKQQAENDEREIAGVEKAAAAFFAEYGMPYQAEKMPALLYEWAQYRREYDVLSAKRQAAEASPVRAELSKKLERRVELLAAYNINLTTGEGGEKALLQLLAECEEYERLQQKSGQAAAHRREQSDGSTETGNDLAVEAPVPEIEGVASVADAAPEERIASLEERIRRCAAEAEAIDAALAEADRQLLALQAQREEVLSAESKLLAVQADYEAGQKKYDTLQKTKQFLEQARSLFTQKYRAPLLAAFQEYYQKLTGQAAEEYFLDADLHLTVREGGVQREPGFFSAGRQDLIGFCMRLALVKVMYRQEKPFILLDDPFANWDQDSIEKGLQFLREISRDYQILYFTCHPSRTLDAGE